MVFEVPHDTPSFIHLIALAERRIEEIAIWWDISSFNLRELVTDAKI
jgi:hypothetical protein